MKKLMKAQVGKTVKPKFTKKQMDTAYRTLAYKDGIYDTTGVSGEDARKYVVDTKLYGHEMGQGDRAYHREEAAAAKKKLNKKQPGGPTTDDFGNLRKKLEKRPGVRQGSGYKVPAKPKMEYPVGRPNPKDKGKSPMQILKENMKKFNENERKATKKIMQNGVPAPTPLKKGGAIKKYQTGGGTAGVRDTYPPATNKSYMPTTPAPAFKKGGAKNPGFKAVQASIAKKSGVSTKAAGAILASASRKASPAAKRANPKLKKVKG